MNIQNEYMYAYINSQTLSPIMVWSIITSMSRLVKNRFNNGALLNLHYSMKGTCQRERLEALWNYNFGTVNWAADSKI